MVLCKYERLLHLSLFTPMLELDTLLFLCELHLRLPSKLIFYPIFHLEFLANLMLLQRDRNVCVYTICDQLVDL